MTAKETTLKELGEMLTHVVDHMATKGDIGDVKDEMADIRKTMATKHDVRAIVAEEFAPIDPAGLG
jgi:hypothetical protein